MHTDELKTLYFNIILFKLQLYTISTGKYFPVDNEIIQGCEMSLLTDGLIEHEVRLNFMNSHSFLNLSPFDSGICKKNLCNDLFFVDALGTKETE